MSDNGPSGTPPPDSSDSQAAERGGENRRYLEAVDAKALAKDVGAVSVARQRENVREYLARTLIWMLSGLLLLGLGLLATIRLTHLTPADIRSFFEVVFTPVIALVSAATGFYFGSSQAPDAKDPTDGGPG